MIDPKTSPYAYPGLHNSAQTRIKHSHCFNKGELDIIAMACCDEYGLTFEEFKGRCRSALLADARKIFFYLCREEFYQFTCKRLGMYVDRDHSTVVYSVQRAGQLLEVDPTFRDKFKHARGVAELRLKLNGYDYRSDINVRYRANQNGAGQLEEWVVIPPQTNCKTKH